MTSVTTPIRTRVSRRFTTAQKPWPVLHLSKWIQTCFDTPEFNGFFLLGGKTMNQLSEVESTFSRFWSHYKYIDGNTPECPQRTVPIYLHGDEGRGLVKRPLLILSFQPIIGWGGEGHANTIKSQHLCITTFDDFQVKMLASENHAFDFSRHVQTRFCHIQGIHIRQGCCIPFSLLRTMPRRMHHYIL